MTAYPQRLPADGPRTRLAEPGYGFGNVLGQAAEVTIDGSGNLSGGEGQADLTIDRIDGPAGRIAMKGDFANATRKVNLDLEAHEGL